MKCTFPAALAALFLLAAGVGAAPIPPDSVMWLYNFTPGSAFLAAEGDPDAGVSFSDEPTKFAVGSSDVIATNLRVVSGAPGDLRDSLGAGGYSLSLTIVTLENDTPHSATLGFAGTLSGTFSSENANVANLFTSETEQVLTLGSYDFTVILDAYYPPGPPDEERAGIIGVHVLVSQYWRWPGNPEGEPSGVENLPEPSSVALALLGLLCAACRRRRPSTS